MISTELVINFILSECENVTNKKLQKLCYYEYAWYITTFKRRLMDVRFEAWAHGPVSPRIYNQYKKYGWNVIPQYFDYLPIDEYTVAFMENILRYYRKFSADDLEQMTHEEDPWRIAREGYKPYESSRQVITDEDIIEYYSRRFDLIDILHISI